MLWRRLKNNFFVENFLHLNLGMLLKISYLWGRNNMPIARKV